MKKGIGLLLAALLLLIPMTAFAEGEEGTPPPDAVEITPAGDSDTYKELLMDSFDQTLLGKNESLRNQLWNVLRNDAIIVTADNYNNIVRYVKDTIDKQTLSDDAAIDHYTDADFEIAADLINRVCDELGLEYSIDPSNDSQNEYARVITIKKNGKLLGRINSDAKTDVGNRPSTGWIIGGGVLIGAAAIAAAVLAAVTGRKRRREA
jgi:hypothetical protein